MCERSHSSCCNHSHEESSPVYRIVIAIVIFSLAIVFQTQGILKFVLFFTAYLTVGWDVIYRALKNIVKGEIFDENFLMSIATIGAFAIKEYPEAVMVMVLYQIGEYLQDKAVKKSRNSITELMDIRPDSANLQKDGKLIQIAPQDVELGDIIVVKTGEKIPLDGTVVDGCAVIDTSALTGESLPVEIAAGDEALSGCINTNGVIKIKVGKLFKESTVSKILELVEHAGTKKAKTEKFITKFARYYTPVVVFAALALAVLPPLLIEGAHFSVWIQRALTFLVISCPCALVISVPLGFFGGIGGASKCGILIKGSIYLEALARPYAIVFDKTGTLTEGSFSVTEKAAIGLSEDELLKYCAMAENYSSHPIAVSIKKAYGKDIDSSLIKDVKEIAGNGVKAVVEGKTVYCGNSKLMVEHNIDYDKKEFSDTVVYCAVNGRYSGYIVISDRIKSNSLTAVEKLKRKAQKIIMLTGDSFSSAQKAAQRLGINEFFDRLLPAQKVEKLERIINEKEKGKSVIFVGDGINDAPVLTRADVGIAMGALGSDAAIEAADVVIMDDKPSKVYTAIDIAQKTLFIVKQNIVFALGIKALFLILGAMGFVTMWGAVFADVGVSVLAVLNSLRTLSVSKNC